MCCCDVMYAASQAKAALPCCTCRQLITRTQCNWAPCCQLWPLQSLEDISAPFAGSTRAVQHNLGHCRPLKGLFRKTVAPAAGVTSENVAAKYSIPREEQDKMAATSHKRAAAATASGRFKDEIVPVKTLWKDPKSGGLLSSAPQV